ncbi:MAG: ATPase, T2SS/T4P/T4SS family, partial [Planctomycetota bacterium]
VWWLLMLGWIATTDWAGRDNARLPDFERIWLPVLTGSFFAAAVLAWWIPWSALAYAVMVAAWLGSFTAYARKRDAAVPPDQRFLSRHQLVSVCAPLLGRLGIKVDRPAGQMLPAITITAGPTAAAADAKALLDKAEMLPGFARFRELMQRGVAARAQKILLKIDAQGGKAKQRIDGVWEPARQMAVKRERLKLIEEWQDAPAITRDDADAVQAAMRTLCGLPEKSGKSRQTGQFVVTVDRKQLPIRLTIDTAADHSVRTLLECDAPPQTFPTLAALGMSEPVARKMTEALGLTNGLIVLSAPPGQGLTTTFTQVVQSADRLTRDFVLLEDASAPLKEIQNVKPFRWGGKEKVPPVVALEQALRGYPTAIVVPDLRDGPLAVELGRLASDILVIVGLQATDALEVVDKLRGLGIPRDVLARVFLASSSQRLIRRLCPNCAETYKPAPELLARLKRSAEAVPTLKRGSAQGCVACCGTRYLGRTGLFELAGGPTVSKAIAAKVDRATLQKAAARDGMQRLLDAGVTLSIEGVTSLEELQRVLK